MRLNIDDLIMFTPLNEDEIKEIVLLQVKNIEKMMAQNDVKFSMTDNALKYITKIGFDPQFGARPIKRVLQKYVLNELSKQIIGQTINREKPIVVDFDGNNLIFKN